MTNDRKSVMNQWSKALWKAYQHRAPIDSPASQFGEISIREAYAVQATVIDEKVKLGERVVGWKVGATSRAIMTQLGLREPVAGCMTSGSLYGDLKEVKTSDFIGLAIEPEVAFVMKEGLRGPGITTADVLTATAGVMGAIELVDCRIKGRRPGITEAIADNSLHAGFLLGPFMQPLGRMDLTHEGMILRKNGRLLASACGVEALGNPVNVVTWLANKLWELDQEIKKGEIILTGSLTPFYAVSPGDVFHVSFSNLGSVHFAVEE